MNENNNRVQRAISAAEYATVTGLINDLEKFLVPYTVGLTPEERKGLPKINVDNRMFIQDALNEMKLPSSSNIMPAFFKPLDVEVDLTMFDQCEALTSRLSSLARKVDNTRILSGSEAFSSALTFKRLADAAEAAGVPGADQTARKLRERFAGQGVTGNGTDNQLPETEA
jgi:predicted transcriptional regulator